ncbi:hypothetical protein [Pseudomonas sp. PLMAX]|uniref:hypothetical protein n=1 Tax=Pseudomonas sp. PLMAX TaxID=2201998 RepID=UPI0038BD614F
MHRIDGPGATVDKKFTEGDPVGGVPATVVTAAWMNDVQEELVSILAAAGITPVKGTQDQILKAIRTITTGAVGASVNARMSITAANASATFTADEVVVKSALGGLAWLLSGPSKVINLATIGAGGMDTGTAPVSGYVAIYAIYNPATGVSALLATNATAAVPEVYGGANMPSGYIASALLTVVPTNASSQMIPCTVSGKKVAVAYRPMINNIAAPLSSANVSAAIPANAKKVKLMMSMLSSTANSIMTFVIGPQNSSVGQANFTGSPNVASNGWSIYAEVDIATPQTVWWAGTSSLGTPSFTAGAIGYEI